MKRAILTVLAVTASLSAQAQVFVNGGFEYFGGPDAPANWRAGAGGIKLDSVEIYSGKYSARVTDGESPIGSFALAFATLPEHVVRNRKIEVKAMLKRDVADTVRTAIFVQKLIGDGTISPPYFGEWHAGKGEWAETSLSTVVEPPFFSLAAGVITTGQGTVWLDDFKVYADGVPLDYAPRATPLTWREAGWLRANTYALYHKPDDKIGNFIGNPRVVGLGEITHGAGDIKKTRYNISKYLIEEKGFSIIAMESTADLMFADINKYLSNPSEQAVKKLGTDVEAVEFLKWVAEYNRRTGRNVRFMGTEIDNIDLILDQVIMLRDDWFWEPTSTMNHIILPVSRALDLFGPNSNAEFSPGQKDKILDALAVCREWAQQNMTDAMDLDLMMHNLELIEKYIDLSEEKRDPLIADNIEWIARRYPDENIIFWAHNIHAEIRGPGENRLYTEGSAGYHLRRKFGEAYYTIATCFYEGSFGSFVPQASDSGVKFAKNNFDAFTASPGSYEYLFNTIGKHDFFLPLRGVTMNEDNDWLLGPMEFRTVGAIYDNYGFSPTSLPKKFDAVVFIRDTEPIMYSE